MDIIEITPDSFSNEEIILDNDNNQSVNFGSGIELLMNKSENKSNSNKNNVGELNINDINSLENELNDLTNDINIDSIPSVDSNNNSNNENFINNNNDTNYNNKTNEKNIQKESKNIFSSIFNSGKNINSVKEVKNNIDKSIGEKTSDINDTNTWDEYNNYDNVPNNSNVKEELTEEELLRKKFEYLKKLEALERKGANLTKKYSMDSDLQEMMGEYEMLINEKEKDNSVKFQGKMLMACIHGLEFLNNKFDPFDVKLDGWSEQVNENIDEYDDIFMELHEKYKSKAKMSPELKLLFQLGGSAIMVHMSNTLFKSAMPGMDEVMRQHPDLMKQFSQAAVNTMGQNNPGFSGFMGNIFGGLSGGSGGNQHEQIIQNNMNRPPSPIETQLPNRSSRTVNNINNNNNDNNNNNNNKPTNNNNNNNIRPDLNAAKAALAENNDIKNMNGPSISENITSNINDLLKNVKPKDSRGRKKTTSNKNTISLEI